MKKLKSLNPIAKIILFALLFAISSYTLQSDDKLNTIGYFSLFAGLFVIFEGFNFSLFIKILIALGLGIFSALSGLFDSTLLTAVKPVGSKIFMNCLTMALVPLVFASILTGVTSLGDIKKLSSIGMRTIIYYICTTAIAIAIGLVFANIMQPGSDLSPETKQEFEQQFKDKASSKVETATQNRQTLFEGLQAIFPKNILESVSKAKPDMLQVIFFALICGIALLQIDPKHSQPIISFFTGVTEMTVRIIMMVMCIAPYGIFALIAAQIAGTQNTEMLTALIPFSICVLLGLFTHLLVLNVSSLVLLSKYSPVKFFKNVKEVMITAFSTASSAATMPLTLEVAEHKLDVKSEVAGFVIPLGATINMDGTALFQGISVIFLANVYGIDLTMADQLTVVFMAVMASIGTAAVPGVGIVILTMILSAVNIPPEGILFILPVNNLLDMFRTSVNVVGDMACSVYISSVTPDKSTVSQPDANENKSE
ncbi:dicarboxylate/amino acid:cation symporter [Candidatus Uabimicrobium sp. HlEnr_7]|uniref:dicarboxylate/amino acid:cation symporter n=1 Tax=Candidatus Uabimicrobium helgolandensis TaxID=3095367 RepID=UPI003556D0AB